MNPADFPEHRLAPATTATPAAGSALALLEEFAERMLPHALRSLALRRSLAPARREELFEEARQELALDCLVHDRELTAMPRRERHSRWFRLIERTAYHTCFRASRRARAGVDLDGLVNPAPHAPGRLPGLLRRLEPGDAALVARIASRGATKRNGSHNLVATARRCGVDRRTLRKVWTRVADGLGFGPEYAAFWERRLAEALTGLAADLLRAHGGLQLWPGTRRAPPDPKGRMRRLRRIRTALQARPVDAHVRSALAVARRSVTDPVAHACQLLDHAVQVSPDDPGAQLWRYEALACAGRLGPAAAALEHAARGGGDPVRIALAKARLHQRGGNEALARDLLLEVRVATRGDRRIEAALAQLDGVSSGPGPRPTRSAAAPSVRRRRVAHRTLER